MNLNDIDQLFCDGIIPVYRRQMQLFAQLEDAEMTAFHHSESLLTLSNGKQWNVQILGLESQGVWMWAWADEEHLPPESKYAADRLLTIGKEQGIEAFTTPKLDISPYACQAHSLAVAAASFHMNDAPYIGVPNGPTSLYMLITDPEYPSELPPPTSLDLGMMLPKLISDYAIPDPRRALTSAVGTYGFDLQQTDGAISWEDETAAFTVEFDDVGRISNITGKAKGQAGEAMLPESDA